MNICLSGTELEPDESLEFLFDNAHRCNARFVELWHPRNTGAGIMEVQRLLDQYHTQVVCVATGSELYRKGGSVADQELLCEAIRLAHELKAPLVNTYFGYASVQDDPSAIETYAALLQPCLELAERYNITICLENEFNAFGVDPCRSDITRRPAVLLQLMERVDHPRFRLTFDPSNFYCAGIEPFPYAYELLKSHIGYVHVKDVQQLKSDKPDPLWKVYTDYNDQYITCAMGAGAVNWNGLLRQLQHDNYGGYYCLEPHGAAAQREASWLQAVQYLRKDRESHRQKVAGLLKGLHHVKLNVRDMERSLDFYRNKLDFLEMARYPIETGLIVQLSHNGHPPGIELWYEEPALAVENKELHIAFEVSDVESYVSVIRDKGVRITREPFRIGHELIAFIEDPDGYQIELNQDTSISYTSNS